MDVVGSLWTKLIDTNKKIIRKPIHADFRYERTLSVGRAVSLLVAKTALLWVSPVTLIPLESPLVTKISKVNIGNISSNRYRKHFVHSKTKLRTSLCQTQMFFQFVADTGQVTKQVQKNQTQRPGVRHKCPFNLWLTPGRAHKTTIL